MRYIYIGYEIKNGILITYKLGETGNTSRRQRQIKSYDRADSFTFIGVLSAGQDRTDSMFYEAVLRKTIKAAGFEIYGNDYFKADNEETIVKLFELAHKKARQYEQDLIQAVNNITA